MKENRTRLFVIAALVVIAAWVVSDPKRYRLGPDLAGGTILIYQKAEAEGPATNIEQLLPALKERLDPAGLYNYVIRALGSDRVEIIMPQAASEDVDRVKRLVTTVGQLQFKIVANQRRHLQLMERAVETWPNRLVGVEGTFILYGTWKPLDASSARNAEIVAKAEAAEPDPTKEIAPGIRFRPATQFPPADLAHALKKKSADGREWVLAYWFDDEVKVDDQAVRIVDRDGKPFEDRAAKNEEILRRIRNGTMMNLVQEDEFGDRYVLMYNTDRNEEVTGEFLTRVEPTVNEGSPAVAFNFDGTGANRFLRLTTEYQPEPDGFKTQLGIVLDNRVRSAPSINQKISSSGVITGSFTQAEVQELVQILDAGKLPFALDKEPSSQFQIAPTLGRDTIERGTLSIGISLLAVIVFVIAYYRYGGLIAIFGLLLNLLLTVGLMVLFQATWTLPGLAGLVLTVGMSIDANILIFERMREELERGASFGMAIRNGYDKAFSAIFDGNLTTIITAIILFSIGTDQVKGFAVTLILGIATSMFCVLYVTRTIFEVLHAERWMRRFHMLKFFTGMQIDFLKARNLCFVISAVVIAVGLAALVYRGRNNFDIDFTGGTMVGMQFTRPLTTAEVRRLASDVAGLPDVSVEEVRLQTDQPGTHFVVRTTARDERLEEGTERADTVAGRIAKAFGDYLHVNKVKAGEPAAIPANAPPPMAAFAGGKSTSLTVDPPCSSDYLRARLADVFAELRPEANPLDLYGLAPNEAGEKIFEEASGKTLYRQFELGTRQDLSKVLAALETQFADSPRFEQFNQFGPQVASETQARAVWAIVLSWVSIIAYVWFRFGSWSFGLAGVIALVHDVLVAVGVMAAVSLLANWFPALGFLTLTDMKINLNGIAAILTLIGFSINDTIVIFDRIREVRGKSPRLTEQIVNRSVNETLSRTLFTSLTFLMAVVILYFGCGVDLRGFSFLLVIGAITGVYSTIYIANPVLLMLAQWQERHRPGAPASAAVAAQAG